MRTQFTHELIALTNDLTLMCRIAHDAGERVVDALVDADLRATYEVFALDEQLQMMFGACEARGVVLLALQAPVARDLRHVVTAIQIASELSHIGSLSSRVADRIYRSHPDHIGPRSILDILAGMGRLAAHRTAVAGRAVASGYDIDKHGPAAGEAAGLQRELRTALAEAEPAQSTDAAIDLAMVGDHLRRCVDHTDRIDRLIRFLDTGVPPTAQEREEPPADS
ncbi:phosphate signaling complex PhoU family protein [Nocardia arizonensis]|uniref:phosphate signaling complex PhoU family protein n=1 Tax=Nocardia arizonensis TaxID=1141647 RepID=UPI0006D02F33|nr:PhoU domain-containing protein [Nocardia arizonensis]